MSTHHNLLILRAPRRCPSLLFLFNTQREAQVHKSCKCWFISPLYVYFQFKRFRWSHLSYIRAMTYKPVYCYLIHVISNRLRINSTALIYRYIVYTTIHMCVHCTRMCMVSILYLFFSINSPPPSATPIDSLYMLYILYYSYTILVVVCIPSAD